MKVFLAGPFFDKEEIERVKYVEYILRLKQLDVYTAINHQYDMLKFGSQPWRDAVFGNDVIHIYEADLVVAIHDSGGQKAPDPGTMWEIGYAYANRMAIVLFAEKKTPMNLMIAETARAYLDSREELRDYDFRSLPNKPYTGEIF